MTVWNQCLFTILKILGPLRIMLNQLFLCFMNGTVKSINICLQHGLLKILYLVLRPTAQGEKKNSLENIATLWPCTWSRVLKEMSNRFMLFLCLIAQGVLSTVKSYYMKNTFHKATVAVDRIPLIDLGGLFNNFRGNILNLCRWSHLKL